MRGPPSGPARRAEVSVRPAGRSTGAHARIVQMIATRRELRSRHIAEARSQPRPLHRGSQSVLRGARRHGVCGPDHCTVAVRIAAGNEVKASQSIASSDAPSTISAKARNNSSAVNPCHASGRSNARSRRSHRGGERVRSRRAGGQAVPHDRAPLTPRSGLPHTDASKHGGMRGRSAADAVTAAPEETTRARPLRWRCLPLAQARRRRPASLGAGCGGHRAVGVQHGPAQIFGVRLDGDLSWVSVPELLGAVP